MTINYQYVCNGPGCTAFCPGTPTQPPPGWAGEQGKHNCARCYQPPPVNQAPAAEPRPPTPESTEKLVRAVAERDAYSQAAQKIAKLVAGFAMAMSSHHDKCPFRHSMGDCACPVQALVNAIESDEQAEVPEGVQGGADGAG